MKLDGKVSLITGGAGGIGAATALELARLGSNIMIVDWRIDGRALEVKEKIVSLGKVCSLLQADMSVPEEVTRSVQETVSQMGSVDVLVHAAGGGVPGSLLEVTPEAWYRAFDIHVHAVFHLCRAAVPFMKNKREGAIILISSAAGTRGCAGAIAYGVAKGALPQFVRSWLANSPMTTFVSTPSRPASSALPFRITSLPSRWKSISKTEFPCIGKENLKTLLRRSPCWSPTILLQERPWPSTGAWPCASCSGVRRRRVWDSMENLPGIISQWQAG